MFDTPASGMMAPAPQEVMMANVLLARCALPSGPAWGVLADDRIEIVATDAGTNGGFLASLLQLPRPVRSLLERRRGAQSLKAVEVMAAPSRDVEGENPLYLPQAKIYRESCALGPVVWLTDEDTAPVFDIAITIQRRGAVVYEGKIATSAMRRSFKDLAEWLVRDNLFPSGAYLLTGTGLVPEAGFSLAPGDRVSISVPRIGTLSNTVVQG